MFRNCLIFCAFLICIAQIDCVSDPKLVCYYDNWLTWRTDESKITVADVDSSLCTHVVYGYLGVQSSGEIYIDDKDLMITKKDLEHFTQNKGKAKALVAIGGWGWTNNPDDKHKPYWISNMISTPQHSANFVRDTVDFMKRYGFDGITIDWSRDIWSEDDMVAFVKVLKALKSEFAGRYILAVTLGAETVRYDMKSVNEYVDFITVQTIDYHGNWDSSVGYGAPIKSMLRTLNKWYDAGGDMTKLIMTIPFYAHTWILSDPSKTEVGADAKGPGRQGKWSQSDGKLEYKEICYDMRHNPSNWKNPHRDHENQTIYAVKDGDTWVTFEDVVTVEEKARTATTEGFGGVTIQALENDDYSNLCGQGKWPLLKAVNKGINKDPIKPRTTTEAPHVTDDPTQLCHKEGLVKDPKDCHTYHNCVQFFPGVWTDEVMHCPSGEGFDEKTLKCVKQDEIPDCH